MDLLIEVVNEKSSNTVRVSYKVTNLEQAKKIVSNIEQRTDTVLDHNLRDGDRLNVGLTRGLEPIGRYMSGHGWEVY